MSRVMRKLVVLAAVVAVAWSVLSGTGVARAANGYEQWTGPDANNCYRYWDGYTYTMAACRRADGGFDYYVPINGRWVYNHTEGYDANGCYYFWNGFQYTAYECPASSVMGQGQPGTGSTEGRQRVLLLILAVES